MQHFCYYYFIILFIILLFYYFAITKVFHITQITRNNEKNQKLYLDKHLTCHGIMFGVLSFLFFFFKFKLPSSSYLNYY